MARSPVWKTGIAGSNRWRKLDDEASPSVQLACILELALVHNVTRTELNLPLFQSGNAYITIFLWCGSIFLLTRNRVVSIWECLHNNWLFFFLSCHSIFLSTRNSVGKEMGETSIWHDEGHMENVTEKRSWIENCFVADTCARTGLVVFLPSCCRFVSSAALWLQLA